MSPCELWDVTANRQAHGHGRRRRGPHEQRGAETRFKSSEWQLGRSLRVRHYGRKGVSAVSNLLDVGTFGDQHFRRRKPLRRARSVTLKRRCRMALRRKLGSLQSSGLRRRPSLLTVVLVTKNVRRGAAMSKEKRASRARSRDFGCPPGIRTPIERVRVASPTIERGGNRFVSGPRDAVRPPPFRVYEAWRIRSTRATFVPAFA